MDIAINEAPLRHQGQSLRIDRLVHCHQPSEHAGWWVLDYKSAAEPERQPALMAQLQRYRAAVQGQAPGERVQAAFLAGDGRMVRVPEGAAAIEGLALGAGAGPGGGAVRHTLAPAPGPDAASGAPQGFVQGSLF